MKKTQRPFPLEPLVRALRQRGDYIRAGVHLHKPRQRKPVKANPTRGDRTNPTHMPEVMGDEAHMPTHDPRLLLIEVAGMTSSEVWAARMRGGLTDEQADRCAVRLGMHPSAIWGDLWLEVERRALFDQIRGEVA